MKPEDFGLNLAKLRISKGISQYKLSVLLDKDVTYINKIENGKAFPSVKMVFEIANALQIEPYEFFKE